MTRFNILDNYEVQISTIIAKKKKSNVKGIQNHKYTKEKLTWPISSQIATIKREDESIPTSLYGSSHDLLVLTPYPHLLLRHWHSHTVIFTNPTSAIESIIDQSAAFPFSYENKNSVEINHNRLGIEWILIAPSNPSSNRK